MNLADDTLCARDLYGRRVAVPRSTAPDLLAVGWCHAVSTFRRGKSPNGGLVTERELIDRMVAEGWT
jgi:hypothetical protein